MLTIRSVKNFDNRVFLETRTFGVAQDISSVLDGKSIDIVSRSGEHYATKVRAEIAYKQLREEQRLRQIAGINP